MTLSDPSSLLHLARQAYRNGDARLAYHWASLLAQTDPQNEEAWLILAAVDVPENRLRHIQTALCINPSNPRALKGLDWAAHQAAHPDEQTIQDSSSSNQKNAEHLSDSSIAKKSKPWYLHPVVWLIAILFFIIGFCFSAAILGGQILPALKLQIVPRYTAAPATSTPLAQTMSTPALVEETRKPTRTFVPTLTRTQSPTITFTPTLTQTSTETSTSTPTPTPTVEASSTPIPPPPPLPVLPAPDLPQNTWQGSSDSSGDYEDAIPTGGERWIDVDLSSQMVYAYEGDQLMASFVASTGTSAHPTVTGQFLIYVKYRYDDMKGPGYFLPDVPYTMYFYKGYALHGTYWHSNFGTPMSHGCINLPTGDAGWLYNWASVGTLVNVHP